MYRNDMAEGLMHVLVVEDYPRVAKRVARMTREILGDRLQALHVAARIDEAETYLASHRVDVLLLDLNLGGDDGFDLLKRFVAGAFQTIVISAAGDRALEAFEYGVLDFVPKPFSMERLTKAFERLSGVTVTEAPRYLAVRNGSKIRMIAVADLAYVQGADNYAALHLLDGSEALHEKNLDGLQVLLADRFERVHRSYLVCMNQIHELLVHGGGRYELVLKSGVTLPVGRTRYRLLRARLEG